MKKYAAFLTGLLMLTSMTACSSQDNTSSQSEKSSADNAVTTTTGSEAKDSANSKSDAQTDSVSENTDDSTATDTDTAGSAVVFFSATGNTAEIAKTMGEVMDWDVYEIIPSEAYTADDLDYNNDNCRANQEMNDSFSRPAISNDLSEVEKYDTIYLGYPIWWGTAPRIINTFLESYDLSGKTIYTFCTSGSSSIDQSISDLQNAYSSLDIAGGTRFDNGTSQSEIAEWLDSVGAEKNEQEKTMDNVFYAHIGDSTLEISAADNSSAKAFIELLGSKDVTIDMHDYSKFEKVGDIGTELPTNDENITTEPGDVILYQGTSITIYYDTNTWDFTRLGKIQNITQQELKDILGDDNVTVTFSLK